MRGGGLLSCSQVDKTEIRRRVVTLQMQAETLGRADQKKKVERRKVNNRIQDLPEAEKQRAQGEAPVHISPIGQQLTHGLALPANTQGRGGRLHPRA